jgi:8-oxo-dGTP pyrophosphatase MutT (NUDIX family)
MPTSEVALVHRQAVRALILTPDHHVLLCRIHAPGDEESFWIAPGGGLEPGETVDAGLRRELQEELGLTDFEAGPVVWRHHTFDWGERRISQKEEYRIVHVDRFDPVMTDEVEAEVLECFRWWPIGDLAASAERFTPLSLADILRRYLRDGPPATLPDEEVLVD